MAGSLNRVTLIGNLGKDPDVRNTPNGGKIVGFSVACTESWKDKQTGEKREKTDWINVSIFNEGLAKIAEQYLKKGSKVFVEGKFRTRKWQDQSGQDRYATDVVVESFGGTIILLGEPGGRRNDSGGEQPSRSSGSGADDRGSAPFMPTNGEDDEIPFLPELR